jgi:hypothetical protein
MAILLTNTGSPSVFEWQGRFRPNLSSCSILPKVTAAIGREGSGTSFIVSLIARLISVGRAHRQSMSAAPSAKENDFFRGKKFCVESARTNLAGEEIAQAGSRMRATAGAWHQGRPVARCHAQMSNREMGYALSPTIQTTVYVPSRRKISF